MSRADEGEYSVLVRQIRNINKEMHFNFFQKSLLCVVTQSTDFREKFTIQSFVWLCGWNTRSYTLLDFFWHVAYAAWLYGLVQVSATSADPT